MYVVRGIIANHAPAFLMQAFRSSEPHLHRPGGFKPSTRNINGTGGYPNRYSGSLGHGVFTVFCLKYLGEMKNRTTHVSTDTKSTQEAAVR
jgi:hypothetical protein